MRRGAARRLARTRRDIGEKLQRIGIEPWLMPAAASICGAACPKGRSADVARAWRSRTMSCWRRANVFSASHRAASAYIRFNVAQCRDVKLMPALQRAIGQ